MKHIDKCIRKRQFYNGKQLPFGQLHMQEYINPEAIFCNLNSLHLVSIKSQSIPTLRGCNHSIDFYSSSIHVILRRSNFIYLIYVGVKTEVLWRTINKTMSKHCLYKLPNRLMRLIVLGERRFKNNKLFRRAFQMSFLISQSTIYKGCIL